MSGVRAMGGRVAANLSHLSAKSFTRPTLLRQDERDMAIRFAPDQGCQLVCSAPVKAIQRDDCRDR